MVNETFRHRAIFISDVHLGTWGCQAEALLDFLSRNEAETIYLIGDIVDCWRLRQSWYWPKAHDDVVQTLLARAKDGTRIVYVPGNHDEAFRKYFGTHLAGIEVTAQAVHETSDGRRFLVLHGDEFDGLVNYAKWLAHLGDHAYVALLMLNAMYNRLRHRLGFSYWSLSAYVKLRVKNALRFIDDFERAVAEVARRKNVDGVICGHIHHAEIRRFGDVLYLNDGDWVESCTAVVERPNGSLEIIRWADGRRENRPTAAAPMPVAVPVPISDDDGLACPPLGVPSLKTRAG
jgi:UDP-2,3-diacylglucosamine pyrophosphatase LpxH